MTTSFPETKTGLRLGFAAFAVFALIAGSPARADDKVLAKVNGVEIKESDVALAEEELAPSLQQMDPATRKDNVLGFLIDLQIVAKAAEDKKIENTDDFKKRLAFTRKRLMMDSLLAAEGKAATTEEAMKRVEEGRGGGGKADTKGGGGARPPHPGRDRGRGEGREGGARQGCRFRRARQEEVEGPGRLRWRRPRLLHQGPDGAGILGDRLYAG